MYQAKISGKNRIARYSWEIAQKTLREREIENELKSFDCDEECHLVYMPLIESRTGDVYGLETLIRWNSPKLGILGPGEFVPIAETCGLFDKIDSWVIERAISYYHELESTMGDDYTLSINISSAQLTNPDIPDRIFAITEKSGVKPTNIQLEMTETLEINDIRSVTSNIMKLRQGGLKIAIDDFGTGFTSFSQMVEYPVDMLKLDRSFIIKVIESNRISILKPLIEMAHSQQICVTAEGVETTEQMQLLNNAGCDYLQGFLFGQPTTSEKLKLQKPDWKPIVVG